MHPFCRRAAVLLTLWPEIPSNAYLRHLARLLDGQLRLGIAFGNVEKSAVFLPLQLAIRF